MPNSINKLFRAWLYRHRRPLAVVFLTFGTFLLFLFSHTLVMKPDGLYAGHPNVWSDWAIHITLGQIFATKAPADWFAYHPYYAGGKLTYAFGTNMISGLLMRAGWSLTDAFLLPSMAYALLFLAGMYAFYQQFTKSPKMVLVAITLFFFTAGPGAWGYVQEWALLGFATPFPPMRDYTRIEDKSWLAGNFVTAEIIPQRAFLLGLTLSIWILVAYWQAMNHPLLTERQRRMLLVGSGLTVGILPVVHMHSLIALAVVLGITSLAYIKEWKRLLWFVLPAGILSAAMYLHFVSGGIQNPQFIRLMIGWTAGANLFAWLHLWWSIWGLYLPLAVAGSVMIWRSPVRTIKHATAQAQKYLLAGFWTLFAIANIICFQPIEWDNSKLFTWVYIGLSIAVVTALRKIFSYPKVGVLLAGALLFGLTATGSLEIYRLLQTDQNQSKLSDISEIQVGEMIRKRTEPRAVFLTEPTHNHAVLMWGARSVVMGYPGWVWNYGFTDYISRQADIMTMFQGGPAAEELLKKYHVSYVFMGPGEIVNERGNETYFASHYPVIIATQSIRVYDVRSLQK